MSELGLNFVFQLLRQPEENIRNQPQTPSCQADAEASQCECASLSSFQK